ncbi:MAG: GCN5-related N-acetyltransferase [Pseudomonadota bacterium]
MPKRSPSIENPRLPGLEGGVISPLRAEWRRLVEVDLPKEAKMRGWPVTEDHCFARILLDNAAKRPWRDVIKPPAWRNASESILMRATSLGAACLKGTEDLHMLNRRSLEMRGKANLSGG